MQTYPLQPNDFEFRFVQSYTRDAMNEFESAMFYFTRRHNCRVSPFEARERVRKALTATRRCLAVAEKIKTVGHERYLDECPKVSRDNAIYQISTIGD